MSKKNVVYTLTPELRSKIDKINKEVDLTEKITFKPNADNDMIFIWGMIRGLRSRITNSSTTLKEVDDVLRDVDDYFRKTLTEE